MKNSYLANKAKRIRKWEYSDMKKKVTKALKNLSSEQKKTKFVSQFYSKNIDKMKSKMITFTHSHTQKKKMKNGKMKNYWNWFLGNKKNNNNEKWRMLKGKMKT